MLHLYSIVNVTQLPHNIGWINELTGTDKLKLKIQSFDDKALKSDSTEFFKMTDINYQRRNPAQLAN